VQRLEMLMWNILANEFLLWDEAWNLDYIEPESSAKPFEENVFAFI
jgi:hypothetical protein